jgi:hypothetical protein
MKKHYRMDFYQEGEENNRIALILYPTARSILTEFGRGSRLFEKKGIIEGHMPGDSKWKWPLEEAIKHINGRGVWGFYRFDDNEIHLWFRKNVTMKQLQAVLSHEVGHYMSPHHRNLNAEETKAMKYEFVASFAHDVAHHLIDSVKKGVIK